MKIIPRKVHIVFDLIIILYLIAYPLFYLEQGVVTVVMLVSGISILLYSLLTKYELGLFKMMNVKNHLALDFLIGLMLAGAPYLLNYSTAFWEQVIPGLVLMLLALTTRNESVNIPKQQEKITF
jgi:ABC-type transport system involved in cytochrome c biogenesis permease subunit